MKNLSVATFIHTLFSVAITIVIATFLLFVSWDRDRQKIEEFKRYQLISLTFLSKLQHNAEEETLRGLYQKLRVFPLDPARSKLVKAEIQKKGTTRFSGGSEAGQVRVFDIEDTQYIYIQRMGYNLLLQDEKRENYSFEYVVAVGVFLILFILFLYWAILKKLYPLRKLHREIQRFASGDMKTKISYVYDDEIGKIAKSFDDAIGYINQLSASKNLFMRNVMHELKTPITKGRIAVEMLEDEVTKKILVRAFERMNELISELAELERVTTQSFDISFESVALSDVIVESQKLLMAEKGRVIVEIEDMVLYSDRKLLALAIKNLLDNGIKYSKEKKVVLRSTSNYLAISSKGEKLRHPLSYYIEPFSQEEKRSSGFGLGLYIVHNILEKLGCHLEYDYQDGSNIFMVVFKHRIEL